MYSEGKEGAKIGIITIDKRGNSYRIRFTYPEGTRHQFTISKATDEGWVTAIKAAQMINRDIDLGDFDDTYARYSPKHAKTLKVAQQKKNKEYNLKELWEMYKQSNKDRVAETTQKHWWREMDKKLDFVEPRLLSLEKSSDFASCLITHFAPSSLRSLWRTCINPCVNQAVKKGLTANNPYQKIELPKVVKSTIDCFDRDEIRAIIAAFYSDEYCPKKSAYKHSYYAPMVEFLALTGCRPEECHALTWDDIKRKKDKVFINFNKAYSNGILLPHTKTHTIRLFPCNEQLKAFLVGIPRIKNKNNLIFPSVKLNYVTQNNFRLNYWTKIVKGLVKDDKVHKYLKPYCLRHSFITRLIREGVDIATVAALSGNGVDVIMSNYLASRREFDLPEL